MKTYKNSPRRLRAIVRGIMKPHRKKSSEERNRLREAASKAVQIAASIGTHVYDVSTGAEYRKSVLDGREDRIERHRRGLKEYGPAQKALWRAYTVIALAVITVAVLLTMNPEYRQAPIAAYIVIGGFLVCAFAGSVAEKAGQVPAPESREPVGMTWVKRDVNEAHHIPKEVRHRADRLRQENPELPLKFYVDTFEPVEGPAYATITILSIVLDGFELGVCKWHQDEPSPEAQPSGVVSMAFDSNGELDAFKLHSPNR